MTKSLKPVTIAVVSVKTKFGDECYDALCYVMNSFDCKQPRDWLQWYMALYERGRPTSEAFEELKTRPVNLRILCTSMEEDSEWLLRGAYEALELTGCSYVPMTVDFVSSEEDLKDVDFFFIMEDITDQERIWGSTPAYTQIRYGNCSSFGKGFLLFF